MQWRDEGIVINLKRHGEGAFIATIVTKEHGKHLGIIKSKKINVGSFVNCSWRARIESQLGTFICEEISSFACDIIGDKEFLYLFNSIKSLINRISPEREKHKDLYDSLMRFLSDKSIESYIDLEIVLLRNHGLRINYDNCYACSSVDVFYVSPVSGSGACKDHAKGYEEKLLRYPQSNIDRLLLNGFFFEKYVYPHLGIKAVESRNIMIRRYQNNLSIKEAS